MKLLNMFAVMMLCLLWSSCSKDTPAGVYLEWKIGDETKEEVAQTIDTGDYTEFTFSTERDGLCLSHGVHLVIKNGDEEIFNQEFEELPASVTIDIPPHTTLEVVSKVFWLNPAPLILCARLGNATCSLEY